MTREVLESHLLPLEQEDPPLALVLAPCTQRTEGQLLQEHHHVFGEDRAMGKASSICPVQNLSWPEPDQGPSLACKIIPALSAILWLNVTSAFSDNR